MLLHAVKLTLDEEVGSSKRQQLLFTLHNAQVRRNGGDTLALFITAAMNPTRHVTDHKRFEQLQGQLNEVLVFHRLKVNDKGQVVRPKAGAATLTEAARLAGELVTELRRRDCYSTPSKKPPSPSPTTSAATPASAPTARTCTPPCSEA